MSSTKHRAVALLVCGKTTGKTYAENGDYIDIFQRFLHASLDSLHPQNAPLENQNRRPSWQFSLDPYDVFQNQEYPDDAKIDDYDGIIITGSPAAAYENVEWVNKLVAFVKNVADNKPHIKLIGICFGHQIIARALGGECVPNAGRWEIGPIPINLTDLGKQIFGVDTLNIQEMHRDHVPLDHTPPNFELLGSSELCYNQGMVRFLPPQGSSESSTNGKSPSSSGAKEDTSTAATATAVTAATETETTTTTDTDTATPEIFKRIQILTTQGHPEFTEPIVTSLVEARSQSGVIDQEAAKDCERRRFWPHHGVEVIGKAIWRVLGVEPAE